MRRSARSAARSSWLRLALLVALTPAVAGATSFNITTFADDDLVNGNCTLREAIRAADLNAAVDACPAGDLSDLITLPIGTYPFSGEELLANGGDLTIRSATLDPLTVSIDLGAAGRFLALGGGGSYVLAGLEIKNGSAAAPFYGGAIWATHVSLEIYNFRFLSNHSSGRAGALLFTSAFPGANLSLHDGTFIGNQVTASGGPEQLAGGAYARAANGAAVDIRDVSFVNNTASDTASKAGGGGLVLYSTGFGSFASCIRCTFSGNFVSAPLENSFYDAQGGGAMVFALDGARSQVVDSRFTGNSTSGGGDRSNALNGWAWNGGELLLERLYFYANTGAYSTLAYDIRLYLDGASSRGSFYDSQITYGTSAGLYVYSPGVVALGHLTIAGYNGIGLDVTSDISTGQVYLENSIVTSNATDVVVQPGSAPLIQTANMIGLDPLFVNAIGGNYHLTAASPAIDVGANGASTVRPFDLDHSTRIVGSATDMGCYEYGSQFADNFEAGDAGSWSPAP
ncbi:MAG: CSLREA domain-containing protein [Thermoanaerobaculia bacterium]|nr:CSLREA domain-containing protein [Thermoanaerobaculia bacterium]MBP9825940.1 CSLREA domain-containing protein [Thermoanaerobaculia bacterium]